MRPVRTRSYHVAFSVLTLYFVFPAVLRALDALSHFEFLLLIPFISFRLTGSYVLYSIARTHYPGYCKPLALWLCAIGWSRLAMDPLPLSAFFALMLPLLPAPVAAVLSSLTVQALLPWLAMVDCARRNVIDISRNFPKLKR